MRYLTTTKSQHSRHLDAVCERSTAKASGTRESASGCKLYKSGGALIHSAIALLVLTSAAFGFEKDAWTMQAKVHGEKVEGTPLSWSNKCVYLLERDGRLREFKPEEMLDFRKVSSSFHVYTAGELRTALQRELALKLEVTGTGHYLVAHPPGQADKWAERFEDLYRSFVHYFSVRGFQLSEPQFPMVAIVWNRQQDFIHYAASEVRQFGPGRVGLLLARFKSRDSVRQRTKRLGAKRLDHHS